MQTECPVCRDWKGSNGWFTPTTEKRRDAHYGCGVVMFESHCPKCLKESQVRFCATEGRGIMEDEDD